MEALSDSLMALVRGMEQTQQRQDERMQALIHSLERKERPANKLEPIKIPEYKEGEDIENFLEQFEGKMQLREVDRQYWLTYLTDVLSGTAREACRGVDYTESTYPEVKNRLLLYFNVTEESQCVKARECKWNSQSSPEVYCSQLGKQFNKWLKPEEGTAQMLKKIQVEGALNGMDHSMWSWIGEHRPTTLDDVTELARTYLSYRAKPDTHKANRGYQRRESQGKPETWRDDRKTPRLTSGGPSPKTNTEQRKEKRPISDITCFKCQKKGHMARDCRASETYSVMATHTLDREGRFWRQGTVNGGPLVGMKIDTGCVQTTIRSDLVDPATLKEGKRRTTVGNVQGRCEHPN